MVLTVPYLVAALALTLAHAFDYVSFLLLVARHGLAAEANPIVVVLAQEVGLPGLTLAKIIAVSFAALVMFLLARHSRALAMGVLVFAIGAGLIGGFSNVAAL